MSHAEKVTFFVFIPVWILISVIEAGILSRFQSYNWKAMGVSIFDFVGRHLLSVVIPLSIDLPLLYFVSQHRLATISLNSWSSFAALFLAQEFCYYWYHRAAHRIRWFWLVHSVHHSSNELNLSAAYRDGLLGHFNGRILFFAPLVWIGFPIKIAIDVLVLNVLYQHWLHTTWIPKLAWLEYIFNTPSAHRVHHASNIEYLDRNYGGVLTIFDRLFGTYVAERNDLPCKYGLVHPQTSYNLLKVEFSPWVALGRDLIGARTLREALGFIFLPPGWKAHGPGETTEELRQRLHALGAPRGLAESQ